MVSPAVQELLNRLQYEIEWLSIENAALKSGNTIALEQLFSKVDSGLEPLSSAGVANASSDHGKPDVETIERIDRDHAVASSLPVRGVTDNQAEDTPSEGLANELQKRFAQRQSSTTGSRMLCEPIDRSNSRTSVSTSEAGTDVRTCHVKLLDSPMFDLATGLLIMLNIFVIVSETQYNGMSTGYALDFPGYSTPAEEQWALGGKIFTTSERIFAIIFTVELAFRIFVLQSQFLKQPSNFIDVFAVAASLADWLLHGSLLVNPTIARVLRLGRLTRMLRIVRASRKLESLRLLLKCIVSSVSTLSWSVLLLVVIQCVAAVGFCFMVDHFITDEHADITARRTVFKFYGTFSRSMITMFEIHFANFAPACRVLVDYVGEQYAYIFLIYRCVAGFAILNVINAVFIERTLATAQRDHEVMMVQKGQAASRYKKALKDIFHKLDANGDGNVTFDELRDCVETEPAMKYWMDAVELDTHDLDNLFRVIDVDGDESITFEEFVSAASKVRGTAKGIDLFTVLTSVRQLHARVETVFKELQNNIDILEVKVVSPSTRTSLQCSLVALASQHASSEKPKDVLHTRVAASNPSPAIAHTQTGNDAYVRESLKPAAPLSMRLESLAGDDEPTPFKPFINASPG